jgi:uncharacterized membrane protein YphA (DoxX/SURF4 family)
MNAARSRILDPLTVLARWFLGGLFIYMGMSKALDPVAFLKLVHQYELVDSSFVLNFIAAALPWFEVFCGVLLIAGIAVRGSALLLVLLLVPFTIVVLRRALAIHTLQAIPLCAVKFDCGCGNGEVWICRKVAENCGLILLSAWLLAGHGKQLCLRYQLLRRVFNAS